MKVLTSYSELAAELDILWSCGAPIGLIPTMGALHEGHLSLARLCGPCDVRVVSIFVNPTQFGPNEDLARYPRTLEQDVDLLEHEGIDYVYAPDAIDMYGDRSPVLVVPGPMGDVWEGAIRPGHFAGVLTVVLKLLHRVRPDLAVFGEKDFQQLALIRAMCRSLDIDVRIVAGKTVREPDGLAMSSRNRFLKSAERERATLLYKALHAGKSSFMAGEKRLGAIQDAMKSLIPSDIPTDYLTAVADDTLMEFDPVPENARLIGAVRVGSVRLIDNLPVSDAVSELSID